MNRGKAENTETTHTKKTQGEENQYQLHIHCTNSFVCYTEHLMRNNTLSITLVVNAFAWCNNYVTITFVACSSVVKRDVSFLLLCVTSIILQFPQHLCALTGKCLNPRTYRQNTAQTTLQSFTLHFKYETIWPFCIIFSESSFHYCEGQKLVM